MTPPPMNQRVAALGTMAVERLEKWEQGADSTKAGQAPARLVDAVLVLAWCVLRSSDSST